MRDTNTGPNDSVSPPQPAGHVPATQMFGPVDPIPEFASALFDAKVNFPQGAGKNGIPDKRRLSVYRNNVIVSLVNALGDAYPSIKAIAGEDQFVRISRHFIAGHPPCTPVMAEFGRGFPSFLESFKPLANAPFLADVARAERLWLDAYHAADAASLTSHDIGSIDPERLMEARFAAHPATGLIASRWPVFDLFGARDTGSVPDGVNLADPQTVLVTRPNLKVFVTRLESAETALFECLISGGALGEAIGAALEIEPEFDIPASIALLITSGAFTSKPPNSNWENHDGSD